jgi:hypothetical protein
VFYLFNLFTLCYEYRALPENGGILDQDSLLVYYMTAFADARAQRIKIEQGKMNLRR